MYRLKKMIASTIAISFVLCLTIASANAKDVVNVGLITAPFGTGSYVLGTALEEIAKKNHPWLKINHMESPGLVYNLKKMETDVNFKKTSIISSADSMLWLARNGVAPMKEKMGQDVRILAIYNLVAIWLGTLDPDIKTMADFAGKKIALGKKTQIGWGIVTNWYFDPGWQMEGKVKYQWVGNQSALRAIKDGLVDGLPIGGYLDPITHKIILTPHTQELMASGKRVYHISPGEEAIMKIREENPGFPSPIVNIPPGTIEGCENEIVTNLGSVVWAASEQLPEEIAYEVVKLLIKHCDNFKKYHALGKLISSKTLCFGLEAKDLHPGAYKAYKEARLME